MLIFTTFLNNRQEPVFHSFSVFPAQELNNRQISMGFIELNEKLVSRPKIGLTAKSFETIAVGFCKRAANVVVVQFFNKFFTAREVNVKLSNGLLQSNS